MSHDRVMELLRRESSAGEYAEIRELWKKHSIAEDARDIAGLISTLTEDCVYEVVPANKTWKGHAGATRFYTELLSAFPDVKFDLTNIVIGPQGVCEEANVTATHKGEWIGMKPNGKRVEFKVVIFFPWDVAKKKFAGERVFITPEALLGSKIFFGATDTE